MTVFIVMVNGKVDEVFLSREFAELHRDNMRHKWNVCEIIEKEVREI